MMIGEGSRGTILGLGVEVMRLTMVSVDVFVAVPHSFLFWRIYGFGMFVFSILYHNALSEETLLLPYSSFPLAVR